MIELIVISVLAVFIFGALFYQSYRDKQRWQRITSGKSLFGNRENIPPLELDGVKFDTHDRSILVIWGDGKSSPFDTVSDARHEITKYLDRKSARAKDARIFAWDGESWKQRR